MVTLIRNSCCLVFNFRELKEKLKVDLLNNGSVDLES